MKKTKSAELYEVLILFLGFFGLNRLYLGQPASAFARLLYLGSALTLTFTGLALLSNVILLAAGALYVLLASLWLRDYLRRHDHIDSYNSRLAA